MRLLVLLFILAVGCAGESGDATSPSPSSDAGDAGVVDSGGAGDDGGLFDGDPPPPPIVSGKLEKRYTEHLGVFIRTPLSPLPPNLVGTDLGVSFPVDGKLAFLFGDNWGQNDDSVAFADRTFPATGVPKVTFATTSTGDFVRLRAGTTDLGPMNVPVEGLTANGKTYVFFVTGFDAGKYKSSVLAHTTGSDFAHLVVDFDAPNSKFINVSVVQDGGFAYVFGSGADYRNTPVWLARVAIADIADRSKWAFFSDGKFGAPEADAKPIVDQPCVGELSVRKHERLGLYLMAYNCGSPRGILLRTATSPTGPWSDAIDIMDTSPADAGYSRVMHEKYGAVGLDDGLSENLGRVDDWGGEYGPYMVPEWFDATPTPPGTFAIVYTMSSWNPYTVSLMRTVIGAPGTSASRTVRGQGLPKAKIVNGDFATGDTTGWTQTGDPFGVFVGTDGVHRVTTYTTDKKEAAMGMLSQTFTVDASSSKLSFLVHGGDAHVRLRRGDEILRISWAHRDNADGKVVWDLEEFRGDTLRVEIVDDITGPWGFIGATKFAIE